jgi:hypothetical protein
VTRYRAAAIAHAPLLIPLSQVVYGGGVMAPSPAPTGSPTSVSSLATTGTASTAPTVATVVSRRGVWGAVPSPDDDARAPLAVSGSATAAAVQPPPARAAWGGVVAVPVLPLAKAQAAVAGGGSAGGGVAVSTSNQTATPYNPSPRASGSTRGGSGSTSGRGGASDGATGAAGGGAGAPVTVPPAQLTMDEATVVRSTVSRVVALSETDVNTLRSATQINDVVAVLAGAICMLMNDKPSWKQAVAIMSAPDFK